ncbi:hypothetical protein H4R26_005070, partial [Coemansia thaxteri]
NPGEGNSRKRAGESADHAPRPSPARRAQLLESAVPQPLESAAAQPLESAATQLLESAAPRPSPARRAQLFEGAAAQPLQSVTPQPLEGAAATIAAAPNYPAGFPPSPPGYERLFADWAARWRAARGVQPASSELCYALVDLVRGTALPSRAKLDSANMALDAARQQATAANTRLSSAEARLSSAEARLSSAETRLSRAEELFGNFQGLLLSALARVQGVQPTIAHAAASEARIDASEAQAALDKAEAALDKAEAALDKAEAALGKAEAAASEARADVAKARADVSEECAAYDSEFAAYMLQRDHASRALAVEAAIAPPRFAPGMELLLLPIALVHSPDTATPSLRPHSVGFDMDIDFGRHELLRARQFQESTLRRFPVLRTRVVPVEPTDHIWRGVAHRHLPAESDITSYFVAEVEPRVRAIVETLRPTATFSVVRGHQTAHADLFLQVSMGGAKHSVAVELKRPYGARAQLAVRVGHGDQTTWSEDAEMPSEAFGKSLLEQAWGYARDGAGAPQAVANSVCRRVFVVSTYNDTWVVRAREAPEQPPAGQPPAGQPPGAQGLVVSHRFAITNGDPHIAFVIANVLNDLFEDTAAGPTGAGDQPGVASGHGSHGRGSHRRGSRGRGSRGRGSRGRGRSGPAATVGGGDGGGAQDATEDRLPNAEQSELARQCTAMTTVTVDTDFLSTWLPTLPSWTPSVSEGSSRSLDSLFWAEWRRTWLPLAGTIELTALLGHGRSGSVYKGSFNSTPAAFKLCSLESAGVVIAEVTYEPAIYNALRHLQGSDVPRLFSHGLMVVQGTLHMVLVLELIEDVLGGDRRLDRDEIVARFSLPESKHAAMDALARVHAAGVLHGDPRADNILFRYCPNGPGADAQPCLVDFSLGKIGAEEQDFAIERSEWCKVLGLAPS